MPPRSYFKLVKDVFDEIVDFEKAKRTHPRYVPNYLQYQVPPTLLNLAPWVPDQKAWDFEAYDRFSDPMDIPIEYIVLQTFRYDQLEEIEKFIQRDMESFNNALESFSPKIPFEDKTNVN